MKNFILRWYATHLLPRRGDYVSTTIYSNHPTAQKSIEPRYKAWLRAKGVSS